MSFFHSLVMSASGKWKFIRADTNISLSLKALQRS
jgi:hypothetical protein